MGGLRRFKRNLSHPHLPNRLIPSIVSFLKKIASFLWKFFSFIAVICGFIYIFYPDISVDPLLFDDGPQSIITPFVISNNGNTTINDVTFYSNSNSLHYSKQRDTPSNNPLILDNENKGAMGIIIRIPKIESHQKYTVKNWLYMNPGASIDSIDVAIAITFYPSFLPLKMQKFFSFTTWKDSNGKIFWYPQPIELSKTRYPFSSWFKK